MTDKKASYHEKYNAFYQSAEWRRLRTLKFSEKNGLCERCLKRGIISKGEEVHHIIPIDEDWDKRLDADNLILLCHRCHNEEHERISPLQKFNKIWEELQSVRAQADDVAGQKTGPKQQGN